MANTILVVEDDNALREALTDTLELAGYRVVASADGREALARLAHEPVALIVSDVRMQPMDGYTLLKHVRQQTPQMPVLLMTAFGTIQQAVEALHAGATDYLVKPFEAEALVAKVAQHIPKAVDDEGFVAVDARTRELLALAQRVAASEATVMITGESGSGKEVLARFIHRHSNRADQPFVAINCAAIPDNMLEAVLFGYEKGAFTGAYQAAPGKFEQAQGGTLLLDEISEMNLGLQAKLLRVLQEREVERLGGRKLISLDVRVMATSNRVLKEEVARGRFREDLFYRLNVFPLHLPPLRERPADIAPLARHLLTRHGRAVGRPVPALTPAAEAALTRHGWPGNVRELDNVMQRALILSAGTTVDAPALHFESATAAPFTPVAASPAVTVASAAPDESARSLLGEDLRGRERRMILEALRAAHGSRKTAAEKLGISARTLRYKLARMRDAGIDIPGVEAA
jgi:two-component system response regulator FlrC